MSILKDLKPQSVFRYFEEISNVPRGSGNRDGICRYCIGVAEKLGLRYATDEAKNVVIYKPASAGYESAPTMILQGHTDMVCQKEEGVEIDFEKDGIRLLTDGEWVKADGTTLGADNGIAMAMILAVLEDDTLAHPPIEALFTADEEIGLLGASALSGDLFSGKRLINLDSEEEGFITVSCAGGCDVSLSLPLLRTETKGTAVTLTVRGLQGGHSGVEIDKGRVNASLLLGRILNHLQTDFAILSVDGGDKGNAIPRAATAELLTAAPDALCREAEDYFKTLKAELSDREPDVAFSCLAGEVKTAAVFDAETTKRAVYLLTCAPNGILEMSKSIENLVETSLNLGVVCTEKDTLQLLFALRSNKQSALDALEEKVLCFGRGAGCKTSASGHYPPWEYREESPLRQQAVELMTATDGQPPQVVAIHAGLECGVLASKIEGLDCISIGPDLRDVHTVNERLSVASTEKTYRLLTELLKACK